LPVLAMRRTKTSVTLCAIALSSPSTEDIGLLAECMVRAKRAQRGRAYVHDIRASSSSVFSVRSVLPRF